MTHIQTLPEAAERLTEIAFSAWIGQATPGDALEYHRGHLAADTSPAAFHLSPTTREELARVARRAWWAAERNLVHLVQRRIGPCECAYLAIARPRPRNAPVSISTLIEEDLS